MENSTLEYDQCDTRCISEIYIFSIVPSSNFIAVKINGIKRENELDQPGENHKTRAELKVVQFLNGAGSGIVTLHDVELSTEALVLGHGHCLSVFDPHLEDALCFNLAECNSGYFMSKYSTEFRSKILEYTSLHPGLGTNWQVIR